MFTTPSRKPRYGATSKSRPPCQFGAGCYRKNLQHFLDKSHPDGRTGGATSKSKPICKFGAACYRENLQHFQDESHPDGHIGGATRAIAPPCQYVPKKHTLGEHISGTKLWRHNKKGPPLCNIACPFGDGTACSNSHCGLLHEGQQCKDGNNCNPGHGNYCWGKHPRDS